MAAIGSGQGTEYRQIAGAMAAHGEQDVDRDSSGDRIGVGRVDASPSRTEQGLHRSHEAVEAMGCPPPV